MNKFCIWRRLLRYLAVTVVAFVQPALAQETPLRVVATFSILADMAREVGGSAVIVTSLAPANADAHVYEPTPADVRRLAQADVILANGLRFEGWIDRLVKTSGHRGAIVVATRGVTPRLLNGSPDPHAWQSLANASVYVDNIRTAFVDARPQRKAEIEARAVDYRRRIDALDRTLRQRFAAIPSAQRRVVTSHDAFGYFGAAYGVEFLAAQGWTTGNEASAADIARLVRQIREQRVRALFLENVSDSRLIENIAREAGAKIGGTLYSDALSSSGGSADSYLKLMEHNATMLLRALQ